MKKFGLALLTLLLIGIGLSRPQATHAAQNKWVADHANVLSKKTMAQIDNLSETNFAKLPGHPRLAVETYQHIPNDDDIDDYKAERFAQLKIGERDWDNGMYFVIAVADRKYGLEVGYGLESAVPDGASSEIVTDNVKDLLKANRYDAAISRIVTNIQTTLTKNKSAILTPAGIAQKREQSRFRGFLIKLAAGIAIALAALTVIFYRLRKAWYRRQLKTNPRVKAAMPLLYSLPVTEQERFVKHFKLKGKGNTITRLQTSFATYIKTHFGDLVMRVVPETAYPRYVYGSVTLPLATQAINATTSLDDLVAQTATLASAKFVPYRRYQAAFEQWVRDFVVSPADQQRVWREFISHVQPEDADTLTPENQIKTFRAIQHADSGKGNTDFNSLPIWVASNYSSTSSNSSNNFGSGSGYSGGSSGGGGFSGGW